LFAVLAALGVWGTMQQPSVLRALDPSYGFRLLATTPGAGFIMLGSLFIGVLLPTSIIGSLPRPAWHTVQLGSRTFLEAMVNARWREQYEDAVSTHLRAQEVAGLDICTDGDAHYDEEIGGWSWQSYPLTHMAGFSREVALTPPAVTAAAPPRGMILGLQSER
jgi:K+ potassium transporter